MPQHLSPGSLRTIVHSQSFLRLSRCKSSLSLGRLWGLALLVVHCQYVLQHATCGGISRHHGSYVQRHDIHVVLGDIILTITEIRVDIHC